MNGRAWRVIGLLILLAMAVAAMVVLRGHSLRGDGDAKRESPETRPVASPDDPFPTTPGARAKRPTRAPLPAVDAPLAVILEPLAARADAGDSRAACRLAMELIRCSALPFNAPVAGYTDTAGELAMEAKGDLDAADSIALAELERLRQQAECRHVPDSLKDRGGHYLAQAARAGEPEAMVRYADVQHWPMDGRGVYSDPEFDRWRRDAAAMLHRAFAAGVPEAPFYLLIGYQADAGGLSTLVPDDPVRAEAIHMLMVRLHGWRARSGPSSLDAESLARAAALARQWHEGPFKGHSYRGQERSTFPLAAWPKGNGQPHEFCTGDRLVP